MTEPFTPLEAAAYKSYAGSLNPNDYNGGAVAEWSKALLKREEINENQKVPAFFNFQQPKDENWRWPLLFLASDMKPKMMFFCKFDK